MGQAEMTRLTLESFRKSAASPIPFEQLVEELGFTMEQVRGGTLMNYVAIAERATWQDEGWTVRSTVPEVLAEFAGWHPDVLEILAATPPEACYAWGLFDHDPLERVQLRRRVARHAVRERREVDRRLRTHRPCRGRGDPHRPQFRGEPCAWP